MATGPYGMTMNEPPNVGTVTTYLADNLPNRGLQSTTTAWTFVRQLIGTELPNGLIDLMSLPGNDAF
jgi:hypothetical protein